MSEKIGIDGARAVRKIAFGTAFWCLIGIGGLLAILGLAVLAAAYAGVSGATQYLSIANWLLQPAVILLGIALVCAIIVGAIGRASVYIRYGVLPGDK